jgi:hypothetical protein
MKQKLDACAKTLFQACTQFEVALAQPGLEATYDVVLYSEFASKEALDAYAAHPTHQASHSLHWRRPPVHGLRNLTNNKDTFSVCECALPKNCFRWSARPRSSPAARAASACKWPKRWASRAPRLVLSSRKQSDLDEAVAHLKARGIEASAIAADLSQEAHAIGPLVDRGDEAPGPHRYPDQQRRRQLGRAGRRLPDRSLGQGDEPEHPQHLPGQRRRSASCR